MGTDDESEPTAVGETKGPSGAERVLAILNALGDFPDGVGLNDLARLLDAPRSSVHRALNVLRRSGLVDQDVDGRYRIGWGLLKLAFTYYEASDEVARLRPVLSALAEHYSETTHYAQLEGSEVVYLAKVQPSTSRYQLRSVIGGRNPAYCTGVGKALLAYSLTTRRAVDQYFAERPEEFVRFTSHTITTPAALHDELVRVRALGYAVDREEHEEGVNCLALPLFLTSRSVPSGAISITAVARRLPLSELEASVDKARALIEEQLGDVLQ